MSETSGSSVGGLHVSSDAKDVRGERDPTWSSRIDLE